MKLTRLITIAACLVAILPSCLAQSGGSEGSEASRLGSAIVVEGSKELFLSASDLVVTAVEPSVDGGRYLVTLGVATGQNAGRLASAAGRESAELTISISRHAFESAQAGASASAIAVGNTLRVVAVPLGWALTAGSEVLAIINDELGEILTHHERHGGDR